MDLLGRTVKEWRQSAVGKLETAALVEYAEPEGADIAAFVTHCQKLLTISGVTNLALANLAPSGYGNDDSLWQGGGQWRERLAFLQKESLDPADIQNEDDTSAPEAQVAWQQRKEARRDAFLKRLDSALKDAKLLRGLSAEGLWGWEPWRPTIMKEQVPEGSEETTPTLPLDARPALFALPLDPHFWQGSEFADDSLLDKTSLLRSWLQKRFKDTANANAKGFPYEGIVLDVTALSLTEGLKLLESAFAPQAPATITR